MRELHFLEEESTETFFVLRDDDGVRYQLARAELEGQLLIDGSAAPAEAPESEHAEPAERAVPTEPAEPAEPVERSLPEPDPLYATPLSMRPNEIQARIRAGASVAELAEEMGVAESRLDSYAHPVMLERTQVAEAAKQSHPVREDGPAKLTLFEILATAFAARGHSIADATWDATREQGDDWVVHVTWQAGLSENEALWSFKRSMGSAPRTEARNAIAADLTDPDFAQPVRSLTAVGRIGGARTDENADYDDGVNAAAEFEDYDEYDELEAQQHANDSDTTSEPAGPEDTVLEGDFLRHPDEEEQPQKRRRKAVTPHWEDVLLGVRTNTKRPKK
ncbi:septation protein SepH [Corynebacterium sp. Marseille-P4321]|uniref:septation protein SepH n=1 Tax=Corynebacterium sp. Marseille-P4321 TaxID=2736603 RepID=UPI00158C2D13|nr:septation protein SepH [Corynebacterium sp. Marseille-P4321]